MNIAALVAIATLAAGTNAKAIVSNGVDRNIAVCMEMGSDTFTVLRAQATATKMFSSIGVTIQWHRAGLSCPPDAIQIGLDTGTARNFFPGALAYARPYEGTHIRIFYDRVQTLAPPVRLGPILALVIVHEITHIVQGVSRHSDRGVMKAHWDQDDYEQMARKPLEFTEEDVDLVYRGLNSRKP
jgi:hypothetical protein